MTTFRRTLAVVITVICLSLACADTLRAADPAALKDSPAAQQATIKYEKKMKAAKQDFQKKLQLLRQEYEAKTVAARKASIASLKTAQGEETKKGKLEVAIAVKNAVTKLEAEGPLTWPKEVLPEAPQAGPEMGPVVADKPGRANVIPAAKGITFYFTNEKKTRELWTLPDDPKVWQSSNEGLRLRREANAFESRFAWSGDSTIQVALVLHLRYSSTTINAFGEQVKLQAGEPGQAFQVVIQRKGDKLISTVNGKETIITLKESQRAAPTRLDITFDGDGITIKGLRVTAKELLVEPSLPAGKP